MISEKLAIIRSEGVNVDVQKIGGSVVNTIALVGKSTKQFSNVISLEAYRKGQFLPDVLVGDGDVIYNYVTKEYYVVVSSYEEVIRQQKCVTAAHLFKCNAVLEVHTEGMTADSKGNLMKSFVVKHQNIHIHSELVTADLRLYAPGLKEDAEYLIYAPGVDISILDKITVSAATISVDLKVVHLDYLSYPGMVLIQATSETRG